MWTGTEFHPVFCVPDGNAIAVEILPRAMNFEVNVQLPVSQFAWLQIHRHTRCQTSAANSNINNGKKKRH